MVDLHYVNKADSTDLTLSMDETKTHTVFQAIIS